MLPDAISTRYFLSTKDKYSYSSWMVILFCWQGENTRVVFHSYDGCTVFFHVGRMGSKVKLSWKLSSISKLDRGYTLTYETPEGLVSVLSKSVVMTVPSHVASGLLRPLSVCFCPTCLLSLLPLV